MAGPRKVRPGWWVRGTQPPAACRTCGSAVARTAPRSPLELVDVAKFELAFPQILTARSFTARAVQRDCAAGAVYNSRLIVCENGGTLGATTGAQVQPVIGATRAAYWTTPSKAKGKPSTAGGGRSGLPFAEDVRNEARLAEQLQHALRRRVGRGQHAGARLGQDLRPRQRRRLGGEVGVADAALTRRHVLQRDRQRVDVCF